MNKRRSQFLVETIIDRNKDEESLRQSMQSLDIDGTDTNIQVELKDGGPAFGNRKETVGTVRRQDFGDNFSDLQSRSDLESDFGNYPEMQQHNN